MITVYHNPNFIELTFKQDIAVRVKEHLDILQEVAEVDTDDLNEAFKLTNHIDSDWMDNYEVTPVNGNHRSTSVGDCMEKDGQLYVVAPVGFEEVK